MGWEIPLWVMPQQGNVHPHLPGIAFGTFSFSWSCCPCCQQPLQRLSGSSLEENVFFFLGALLFPDPSGSVANWFLFGERFLPLGKTSTASCLFKITPEHFLLEKTFLFLGFGERDRRMFHLILLRSLLGLLLCLLFVSFTCPLTLPLDTTTVF